MNGSSATPLDLVVATDGSESAELAVTAAVKLARALGGRVIFVYVRSSLGALGVPFYQEKVSEQMNHARAALDRAERSRTTRRSRRMRRSSRETRPSTSSSSPEHVMLP